MFAEVTTAMTSAQSQAVQAAQSGGLRAPAELTLNFSGPCTLGGTVGVTGSYDTSGSAERAAFDLDASFDNCRDATGTLDGGLAWTSVAEANAFSATMSGDLAYDGPNASFSCSIDLHLAVDSASVSYSGSICDYDIQADLGIRVGN